MERVSIDSVKQNPDNPRVIKDDKFKKLVKSIQDFPKMLDIRPIVVNNEMIVLGGNMRLKACKSAGMKEIPIIRASELTEEEQREFVIKDNVGFGQWDWDMIANQWDQELVQDWGLDIPDMVDQLEDGEEMEFEQSVQIEPPREYIMILAEPNSQEWEDLKERLQLKMVRKGGYKKGSDFDQVGLERVILWEDLKNRLNLNDANSSTK
jgi:hypothetical protein